MKKISYNLADITDEYYQDLLFFLSDEWQAQQEVYRELQQEIGSVHYLAPLNEENEDTIVLHQSLPF